MNELDLLLQLNEVEQKIQIAEIKRDMVSYKEERPAIIEELAGLRTEETGINHALTIIEDKTNSQNAKVVLRRQIAAYLTEINKARTGLKLLRDQGTIIEYYLLTKILNDVSYLVRGESFGIRIPISLLYTYSDTHKTVAIDELSNFLNAEIQILNNLSNINYPVLRTFLNEFQERLITKFVVADVVPLQTN